MAEKFEFDPEVYETRFKDHWALAEHFQEAFEKTFSVKIGIDHRRLYIAIISAYDDIARYKTFHLENPEEEKSDAIKRAAYLTKWICRFKPLQVNEGADFSSEIISDKNIDYTILVNELFAIHVATTHLSVHAGRDFVLTPDKEYELVYDLLFRNISEDALMIIYQTLADSVSGVSFFNFM